MSRILRQAAHPRSRGEHIAYVRWLVGGLGSSPLARGTCLTGASPVRGSRLIPARAGNIRRDSSTARQYSAHPRSRGEHDLCGRRGHCLGGSSPLARGTYISFSFVPWLMRLIPARAGNISAVTPRIASQPAHPRSRGEHPATEPRAAAKSGSSPLARGTSCCSGEDHRHGRLIPARAGNIAWNLTTRGGGRLIPARAGNIISGSFGVV